MDTNIVVVKGRLTKDVDFKVSEAGYEIAHYCIAVNHYTKDKDKPKVSFFDIVSFGHTAKYLTTYTSKGDEILVQGELEQQSWTNQGGDKKTRVAIKGLNANLLRKKNSGDKAVEQPVSDDSIGSEIPF
jgi:single-strand DNA-binding protein